MCGFAGFRSNTSAGTRLEVIAREMADRIAHRGPDDAGAWVDAASGMALAHRRLSILDLSPAGHQPMHSGSGRYVLVFNGEIYNHLSLRQRLSAEGYQFEWRGHSDTETLLACVEAWGLERALQASVGMFAIALWDRSQRILQLARDRMGEKPLYYGWQNGTLLFGSELKALTAHPDFEHRVNRDALALLLRHNYIAAPHSIWQGIYKLLPGTILTLADDQRQAPVAYWQFSKVAEAGEREPLELDLPRATDELERILGEAVSGQMLADVSLGALLSGGVDSSTIAALMQRHSSRPIKTFCIGFHEKAFDESAHASAVARHLGTDHAELFLTARNVLEMIPRMADIYDEPFADSSQLPTALVMSFARQSVTVALSGDGGDEVFGGYNRYRMVPKAWSMLRLLPSPVRRHLARVLLGVPVSGWDRLASPLALIVRQAHIGNKLHKLARRLLRVSSADDLYVSIQEEWPDALQVVRQSAAASTLLTDRAGWPQVRGQVARMMSVDALGYLPDDILVKVDRAAMAYSLETRAPFLDHRVIEFAARLPMSMKVSSSTGKMLLRQVLHRHVPQALIERPKIGFGIPLDRWLRHELRDWAESLLDPRILSNDGFFDVQAIRAVWQQHLLGTASHGYQLWSVLMFQSWWRSQRATI